MLKYQKWPIFWSIFTRRGTPKSLLSDRGPQFTSGLLQQACRQWGVVQKLTTVYHPQINLTKRVNCTLKTMISSYVQEQHVNWDQWLHELCFAINSAKHDSTGYSPTQLALGHTLKGPLERLISVPPTPGQPGYVVIERQENLFQVARKNLSLAQNHQTKYYKLNSFILGRWCGLGHTPCLLPQGNSWLN